MNRWLGHDVGTGGAWARSLAFPRGVALVSSYRVLVGSAVTLHFLARAVAASLEHSWQKAAVAAGCAVLGVVLVCGIAKWGAALGMNVLAVVVYHMSAKASLDDYAANVIPLVLLLVSSAEPTHDRKADTMGVGLWIVCVAVVGVYIGGGPFAFFVDSSRGPAWIRWAFRATAVLLVAPSSALRAGALITQVLIHTLLFALGPYRLVHMAFGSAALLFMHLWSTSNRRLVVDAASVLGMATLAIAGAAHVGTRFFDQDVSRSARALAAIGVLPFPSPTSPAEGAR